MDFMYLMHLTLKTLILSSYTSIFRAIKYNMKLSFRHFYSPCVHSLYSLKKTGD